MEHESDTLDSILIFRELLTGNIFFFLRNVREFSREVILDVVLEQLGQFGTS